MKIASLLFVIVGLLFAIAALHCALNDIPNIIYITTSMMFICVGMLFNTINNQKK